MNDKTKLALISKLVDDALEFYADKLDSLAAIIGDIWTIIHFGEDTE